VLYVPFSAFNTDGWVEGKNLHSTNPQRFFLKQVEEEEDLKGNWLTQVHVEKQP